MECLLIKDQMDLDGIKNLNDFLNHNYCFNWTKIRKRLMINPIHK